MSCFEYLEARSLRQALSSLGRHGEEARIVAGATDFLIRWRQGTWNPAYVVSIKRIPGMDRVSYNRRTGLRLGALATVRTLETHPLIRTHYPVLSARRLDLRRRSGKEPGHCGRQRVQRFTRRRHSARSPCAGCAVQNRGPQRRPMVARGPVLRRSRPVRIEAW